jgi:hypothetical protein
LSEAGVKIFIYCLTQSNKQQRLSIFICFLSYNTLLLSWLHCIGLLKSGFHAIFILKEVKFMAFNTSNVSFRIDR